MNTHVDQTLLMATGNPADLYTMHTAIGDLNTIIPSMLEERSITPAIPQGDFKWMFEGDQPNVAHLAKQLSLTYPTLTWNCYIPTAGTQYGSTYTLTNGIGTRETIMDAPDRLPDGDYLLLQFEVGLKSHVFKSAYLMINGSYCDVTDEYMETGSNRFRADSFDNPQQELFEWSDDDIHVMLGNAH